MPKIKAKVSVASNVIKTASKTKAKTKTKKVVKKTFENKVENKKVTEVPLAISPIKTKPKACVSSCWLCWLFKLMIAMFVIMIIFWLGFCFGALSWQLPANQTGSITVTANDSNLTPAPLNQNMCLTAPVDTIASSMTSTLQNKQAEVFDKEWLLQMSIQNQGVIEMSKLALEKSSNNNLKKLAQQIIDFNEKGITKIKAWQSTWAKDSVK